MREKLFQLRLKKMQKRGERWKREYEVKKEYSQYVPERKKRKVSNILLAIVVVAITAYTVANLWITYATGVAIDSTLTTCFYTFWGSELIALATLKTVKIVKNYNESDSAYTDFEQDEPCE